MTDTAGAITIVPEGKLKIDQAKEVRVEISMRKRRRFLETLRRTGRVGKSAESAGYTSSMYLRRLYHTDKEFAKEWDEALAVAVDDVLEPEAWERAVNGVEKNVMYKGEVVDTEVVKSDALLMFLMRGNKPDKYRENVSVSGTINHKVGIAVLPMTAPSMEEWERGVVDVTANQKLLAPPEDAPVEQPSPHNAGQIVVRR